MAQNIVITSYDLERLNRQIESFAASREFPQDAEYIKTLKAELDRASVVEPTEIPQDTITMNSRVRIQDPETGTCREYTLVFPQDADPAERKVSILAPLGTALIGYRVGDIIDFKAPAGVRRMKVVEILYQPEAAGDFTA